MFYWQDRAFCSDDCQSLPAKDVVQTEVILHRTMHETAGEVVYGVGGHIGSGYVAKGEDDGVVIGMLKVEVLLFCQIRLVLIW